MDGQLRSSWMPTATSSIRRWRLRRTMAENSSISWTTHTWNPVIGCSKVSPACDGCLDPETLVLLADGTWRKLSKLSVGDELYGFEEGNGPGRNRFNCRSVVEAIWPTRSTTITITTASGKSVTCSPDRKSTRLNSSH